MLFCVFERLWRDMVSIHPYNIHRICKNFNGDSRFDLGIHMDELNLDESVENNPLPFVELKDKIDMLWGDMRRDPDIGQPGFLLKKHHHDIDSITDVLPNTESVQEIWSWFDAQRRMYSFLGDHGINLDKIGKQTQKYLGINLSENNLHIGCIYVVKYSPIKSVHLECIPTLPAVRCEIDWHNDAIRESLIVKVRERVTYKQSDPSLFDQQIDKDIPFALIQMNSRPRRIDVDFENEAGKVVYFLRNVVFISTISIGDSKSNARASQEQTSTSPQILGLEHYLKPAILEKDAISKRKNLEFVYFDGDPNKKNENRSEAMNYVAKILERAKKHLIIADPYFSIEQFNECILPIPQKQGLQITIINCKEQLQAIANNQKITYLQLENDIQKTVSEYNSTSSDNHVSVVCLTGQGRLHDRFIIADGEGWQIGSSLGEFGARACCIVKLLDSAHMEICNLFNNWSNDSTVSSKIV